MLKDTQTSPTFFKAITRLLDNIGLAMYSSVPRAIGELVANSYDADAEIVRITIPKEFGPDSGIIIEDNGIGMTRKQIDEEYMVLGLDRRKKRRRTPKGRLPIGNKGIGKLAGLGIAEVMFVETVHDGIKCSFEIDKSKMDKADKPLSEIPILVQVTRSAEANGTRVRLSRLLPRTKLISPDRLLTFLTMQFGLNPDFQIIVNGVSQSAKSLPGKKYSFKDTIPDCGEVTGYYVVADRASQVKTPGFMIRVRGRAVLGPTVFRVFTSGRRQAVFTTGRILGELNADFLDPEEPATKYDEFIITTPRDSFNESDPKFQKLREWAEDKIREIVKGIEEQTTKKRRKRILEDKRFTAALKRLPPHLREYVLNLIDTIIPRLARLSGKDADFVLSLILKASESSEFMEILKKMDEAGIEDIGRLAALLQDWGVYEITAITEWIKRRLSVIDRFETFAEDIETLEYEQIHKTLESNLWLLDDSYRLYGSNRTLKKILDQEIQKRFKRHERDRPDLICKALMDKLVIIELKRPSHEIVAEDMAQLTQYKTIVREHSPGYRVIESYLIGRRFDEAVRDRDLEKAGFFLRSYSEIISEARDRYREIIEILEQEIEG